MTDDRADLHWVRKRLRRLVIAILIAVLGLLALTFYLYARFTRGITVAP
ncbi:MAG TPA: hypothetical protein VHE30_19670 [Polyangiaceae bacterium]|nr:hypothetical protein [Polyangiaceae bacterium]